MKSENLPSFCGSNIGDSKAKGSQKMSRSPGGRDIGYSVTRHNKVQTTLGYGSLIVEY